MVLHCKLPSAEREEGSLDICLHLTSPSLFFSLGKIEFTWQEVMIGLESSVLMFPINLLIVQIFRNTRPRLQMEKDGRQKQGPPNLTPSAQPMEEGLLTPETVTKACSQPLLV